MKIARFFALACAVFLWCTPVPAMESLSNTEMDEVRAGAGVSLSLTNLRIYRYDEYMAYRAVDGDPTHGDTLLQLSNILYNDNDTGSWWQLNDQISGATFHTKQPVTIDVFNNAHSAETRPMLALQMPEYWQEKYVITESLTFAGVEMGPANINYPIDEGNPSSFALYTTPLDSGIGLQLEFGTVFEQFQLRYRYNQRALLPDQQDFLTIGDLHIGGYIDGSGNVAGNFQIGDLNPRGSGEYNPMEIHVAEEVRTYHQGTDQEYSQRVSFLRLEMPMEGCIRLGTMQIGPNYGAQNPTEFGPIHVDGIKAHRLTVDLIAGRENI
ncbi:MAG: hypothetical protein K9K62_06005 [Desulfobacteraceae bacterium]|nr:hypothetical protein [Desulfobacteraceae bacterium]